jgi:hypothetical protein
MANGHGVEDDKVAAARQLLERCGLEHAALSDDQAMERAGKIAAAATDYERTRRPDLGAVFDEHIAAEFQLQDVDATMSTMTDDPYLDHVPVMTGGVGREEVRHFYANHFIGKWPPDTAVVPLSRTVGESRVVDELIASFTHTNESRRCFRASRRPVVAYSCRMSSSWASRETRWRTSTSTGTRGAHWYRWASSIQADCRSPVPSRPASCWTSRCPRTR